MKVAIINGSPRENSQSEKVANYLSKEYQKHGLDPSLISLKGNPFPLWDESIWSDDNWAGGVFKEASNILKESDLIVVVCPEYNGLVPPSLQNFFLLAGKNELGHKPALAVTVSAGRGGAYPVLLLRMSGYKNTRLAYMPDHLIVREATKVLNTPDPENPGDKFIREKIEYTIKVSKEYAKAFIGIRESGVVDFENHGNGMS